MKSDIISIDHEGKGFENCLKETEKFAQYQGLTAKQTIQLKMIVQEMLSLARSVTGGMQASFWLEGEGKSCDTCMTTHTVMDKEKRYLLLSSATSRKNEITNTFLGKLRNAFEEAMTAEADHTFYDMPSHAEDFGGPVEDTDWDRFERSVLRGLADNVKIAIRGDEVRMTVSKNFAE